MYTIPRSSARWLGGSIVAGALGSQGTQVRKKSSNSDELTYLEYECVPGDTIPRTRSAMKMVKKYASGVRAIVERTRCPPGYRDNEYVLKKPNTTHLDKSGAGFQKLSGIVNVLNDLQRAY